LFINKFKLNLNVFTNLCQWIFKISYYGSNAGVEMPAPLVNGIANNALFHPSPHINQTIHQII